MENVLKPIIYVSVILISSIVFTSVSADHIITARMIHAVTTNPVSVFGKTYNLQVGNNTRPIYYGFNVTYATISSISLVQENNSMQIYLKGVTATDAMWIYVPQDIILVNNNFSIFVDGQEVKYELATFGHSTILGYMVPSNSHLVEIQGARVIPEFSSSSMCVMLLGLFAIVFLRCTSTNGKFFSIRGF